MARQIKNNPVLIALWAVVLVATVAVVVVVNVWKGSSSETSLTVQIQALPEHVQGDVVVHAPGGRHWVVHQSRTFSHLRDGRYTVTARPVSDAVFKYSATSRTQMVTLSGGSRTVAVQYLNMVRKSVHSVEIRTCTNGPTAVLGHTLVFAPAAVDAKGDGISHGTVLYVPTCGVRPDPLVVEVKTVTLGLGIVAATTQLLSDSGVYPLASVFPRGEIDKKIPLNSTDGLIKKGYLDEHVPLDGCTGVEGSADVRAHLQLSIKGKWRLGAIVTNPLHGRLPLPFTTLQLQVQATQSANLVVLADGTVSCTHPISLPEVDLGEWPVDLGIVVTLDPKLEFDASVTVKGSVQASYEAQERMGETATASLTYPFLHVTSVHKFSSKASGFAASLQSVKVAFTPRLEVDVDGWPVGLSTSVGMGAKLQIGHDAKSWSLYGWLGAGNLGLNLGRYDPETKWAFWQSWLLRDGSLAPNIPPPPTTTSTSSTSTTSTTSTSTSTTTTTQPSSARICESNGRGSSAGRFFGSVGSGNTTEPAVAMACSPEGTGYWLVSAEGQVESFGAVSSYGSLSKVTQADPVVGIAATADGSGYWVAEASGDVVAFGDARRFVWPSGEKTLNAPVVGITGTPSGQGYWLVAGDGGVFAFGDAEYLGSMGSVHLNAPVVGMAASSGSGYWLVAQDGGVFAFGTAGFFGSGGAHPLRDDAVGMLSMSNGLGYWVVQDDGTAVPFTAGLDQAQPTK